jgi:gas vesicle protein
MSQQGNFVGGFLLGTVLGGLVGGVAGVVVASRLSSGPDSEEGLRSKSDKLESKPAKKRQFRAAATEQNMEVARRGLEDKIAQLNDAIDDVRQQLSSVNGNGDGEQSTPRKV